LSTNALATNALAAWLPISDRLMRSSNLDCQA